MSRETNELERNLKYLKLNLDDVPEILQKKLEAEMKPSKGYEESKYRVYKHVPISKIKILLTRTTRLDSIQEKIKKASPLSSYLIPEDEEGIIKHTIFLKMIQNINIDEIDNIEREQEKYKSNIPFKVKYKDNYLWQICYSEYSDSYYMLATTEDLDNSCLFYIIKKQIEFSKTKKDETIFVPISYADYSRKYFVKSQSSDIEKYLWQFTKDWPQMYEVYDKENNMSFQIVGNTAVYEKINSLFKIVLENKEDATKFYKLIKALFILETEFPNRYKFDVQISELGGLEFLYNSKTIEYETLAKFIKEEFIKSKEESEKINEEIVKIKEKLEKLKIEEKDKEEEYRMRQKQVAIYLKCKKSFFGRIRYYFRGKKNIRDFKKEIIEEIKEEKKEETKVEFEEKEYYTIEDLTSMTKILERVLADVRNTKLDIKAQETSIARLNKRIENAKKYIDEIEEHKKSIFEFWSFVNKDNPLRLK